MSNRKTVFSPCRKYRYALWREWDMSNDLIATMPGYDRTGEYLMVIGLNPSTADETKNDPTIRRCVDFAERWGFGALCMTNLFAWRDTLPEGMKKQTDPIGKENDSQLANLADKAGMVIAAWGKHGSHLGRAYRVCEMLAENNVDLHCLRLNADNSPQHPLYVPADTLPQSFSVSRIPANNSHGYAQETPRPIQAPCQQPAQ